MTTERMRARVHAAADRIDVPAFDPQAVVGATSPRPRMPWVPVAVAVSVGLALGSVAWLVVAGDDEPGPAANTETATPGALVALALEHIEAEPSYFEPDSRSLDAGVSAAVRFGADGEYDGDQVGLLVSEQVPDWLDCSTRTDDGCVTIATGTGDVQLSWDEMEPEEDPGYVTLSQVKEDGIAVVTYSGRSIVGDPRKQTLPVSIAELVEVVSDPAFGPTTTPEAIADGKQVDWGYRAPEPEADPVPPSTTSAALAAAIEASFASEGLADLILRGAEEVGYREPGGVMRDGWGLRVELRGGYTLHVIVLAGWGPGFLACQQGMQCWDFEGIVLTGRPGLAGAFISEDPSTDADGDPAPYRSTHVWLEGPDIDPQGPEDFVLGETFGGEPDPGASLLAAVVRLVNADGISQQTSQRWLDLGARVDWLRP